MSRNQRRALALAGLALVVAGGIVAARWGRGTPARERRPGADVHAPEGVRIRVEVLNAGGVRGLGRLATLYLRERGFDVVSVGNASAHADSSLVLDRTGHPEWARLVARAMGGVRTEARPDSSAYVDVTVLLGPTWRAPAQPLDP